MPASGAMARQPSISRAGAAGAICAVRRRPGLRSAIMGAKRRLRLFAEPRSVVILSNLAANGAKEVAGRHGVALTALAYGAGSLSEGPGVLRRQRI